ncbi:MAG: zinc ribbon domain-containing protein [Thermoplasmata archaeon]|nr:zinc ribbon domain-containing protein [Thermoplasmata archaeon]
MPEVRKNPVIAAVFSFLVWGLGEMYAAVTNLKIAVGMVLFVGWMVYLFIAPFFIKNILFVVAILLVVGVPLAFDAFRDAKAYNMQIKLKEIERKRVGNICPACGAKLEGNPRFCPQCGKKLVW